MKTKAMFKLMIVPIVVLLLASCQDVVQIKLDEGSKIYVIDAFVNNLRAPQNIKVTTNDSYFSNKAAPAVTNANVVLVDLTLNASYNFIYTSNGNYTYSISPTDTIARLNHNYLLKVTIDGYTYTSQAQQKRTAVLDSIADYYNDGSSGFGVAKDSYFCLLFARDKADNNPDYYWIRTFRNDTLFNDPGDLNTCIDGTGSIVLNAPTDTIPFTPSATFLGFKAYRKNDKCKVEIHSISHDTYFFFAQALNQITNGGLFATTPENIKSNIITPDGAKTKAIGWFNMASAVTKTKLIQ